MASAADAIERNNPKPGEDVPQNGLNTDHQFRMVSNGCDSDLYKAQAELRQSILTASQRRSQIQESLSMNSSHEDKEQRTSPRKRSSIDASSPERSDWKKRYKRMNTLFQS
jgi:hypothetical protein